MRYTDHYSLKKPQPAEQALVSNLNDNADSIDTLIYQDRRMMAKPYDSTRQEPYVVGERCIYENRYYKCVTQTSGNWDASDWDETNIGDDILEAMQSGGTEVIPNPTGTATEELTKVEIDGDIYEIPEVVPNPTGTPTDTLDSLEIGGTIYGIQGGGGGSTVVPNPQGTPTSVLNTLGIDNVIYSIPSGGGGGGSSYSTSEIQVGTWIDGSIVYRRVIDCQNATSGSFNFGVQIYTIRCYGVVYDNSNAGQQIVTSNIFIDPMVGILTYSSVTNRQYLYIIVDYLKVGLVPEILNNWDFTQSLTDSVSGVTVTLGGGATRTNTGITLDNTSKYISIPTTLYRTNRVYEVDIGNMVGSSTSSHRRLFMYNDSCGFIYRSTGKWAIYYNQWTESSVTDVNYFANSTLKVEVDEQGGWKVYKDDTLVQTYNSVASSATAFTIGASTQGYSSVQITGLRIKMYGA